MYCLFSALVIIVAIGIVDVSTGYKWVSLKAGDPIPNQAVMLDSEYKIYIGRSRHYNLVLPAEIYNSSYAVIYYCSKQIAKEKFQILVLTEHCEWVEFREIENLSLNVVRIGAESNGEPIFLGKTVTSLSYSYITSILITSNQLFPCKYVQGTTYSLNCDNDNKWIEASAKEIPKNSISGGKSGNGHESFVGRLLSGCNVVAGEMIPELGLSMAVFEGNSINSLYYQALIGNYDKYSYHWMSASNGQIPDYAIVGGKYGGTRELTYVARLNKTLEYITHKQSLDYNMTYNILVKISKFN